MKIDCLFMFQVSCFTLLHVEVFHFQGVVFDELAAAFHVFAHQD
ncbi:MAG: hypothetical protein JWN40_3165, partial [Phycisphaerales bacterium]|nr:hypothetical protein [Phycisphaerales bacterium]